MWRLPRTEQGAAPSSQALSEDRPASGVQASSGPGLTWYDVRAVLSGAVDAELTVAARKALRAVAEWLDGYVSKPDPAVGRSGEVCPWTRHTIDLGKLELSPIASRDATETDAILRALLERFTATEPTKGADASFRSLIGVFYDLEPESAAAFMVAAHTRSKPAFLDRGLMLGEFYPTCDKPGLRSKAYRPLRSPVPLLVVRQMVEADIEFLLDKDEFVEAYLRVHRRRGLERLSRILEQRPASLPPDRAADLARVASRYAHLRTRPPSAP